eukprot:SAG31_NODE_3271_length_4477_cov_2.348561_5_plen_76_part_00
MTRSVQRMSVLYEPMHFYFSVRTCWPGFRLYLKVPWIVPAAWTPAPRNVPPATARASRARGAYLERRTLRTSSTR